LSRAFDFI